MRAFTKPLPPAGGDPREVAKAVNSAISGKINSVGTITLLAGSALTVLTDLNIGLDSMIVLSPITENAKAEGHPWVQITQLRQATLNHANNAQTDRTYRYAVLG